MDIQNSKAYSQHKKLVLAWDPDYTKLTPGEAEEVARAKAEMDAGDYVTDDEIDWDS